MKQLTKGLCYKSLLTFLMIAFVQTVIWAQDNSASSSSTTKSVKVTTEEGANWYASPLIWIVGAAIFILLLVALLRGGNSGSTDSRTERVTVTKSTTDQV